MLYIGYVVTDPAAEDTECQDVINEGEDEGAQKINALCKEMSRRSGGVVIYIPKVNNSGEAYTKFCNKFGLQHLTQSTATPQQLLQYLASTNMMGLSQATKELPKANTVAPCKHLAQVQPFETLAFAGFVSKYDKHLPQKCTNLWDETLAFVQSQQLTPDPAGRDNGYKENMRDTLDLAERCGAGVEVAHSLFKLSFSKGVKTIKAPLPLFPAGFDNCGSEVDKNYFLKLYTLEDLEIKRAQAVDENGETHEERLVTDTNLFASQCIHGFMQGQEAMVKTPYPIFPPPVYSWAHAAQYICEHQPCTLLPPKITQYLQNIPLGSPKDNATRHIVAKEMRQALPECIKLHNSRCPSQPCTRGLFVTVSFPGCYMILETWMRPGYIMTHLNHIFQKALHDGFCKQRLIFAAMGVEMHPGETQDKMKKTMADQLLQEHYKTLQDAGLTSEEITELLPEGVNTEMVRCQDHTKVGTLMYRRVERGSLVGAAHLHITILYSETT